MYSNMSWATSVWNQSYRSYTAVDSMRPEGTIDLYLRYSVASRLSCRWLILYVIVQRKISCFHLHRLYPWITNEHLSHYCQLGLFQWNGWISIPVWIIKHMPSKVCDRIIYPFRNFSVYTAEIWKQISTSNPFYNGCNFLSILRL